MDLSSNWTLIDTVIAGLYLCGSVAVGVYVNRYIRGMADFVVAGRSLRSLLAIATMVGSELGLVTVMYAAQTGFGKGFSAFHIALAGGLVTLLVGLTGFIVIPLRRMGVMTIPEFYERRYSRGVRIFGGLLLGLAGILNMGMFLKAGGVFVTSLTGLDTGVHVNLVMTILILLVLAYTTLGGMVSVVITDYIQFVVLSAGLLAACALALGELGWTRIIETVEEFRGAGGFDPFVPEPDGFGAPYVLWQVFMALVSCAIWQTAVLRACAAESTVVVRKLYVWSSIGFLIRWMVPQFLGICALTYFLNDPRADGYLFLSGEGGATAVNGDHSLEAMPLFLGQVLPVGLIGLVGAGMLAAFMSTHDTYLLCWATVLAEDVVHPLMGERLSERQRLWLTRAFILVIAAFLLIWSLWYPLGQRLWSYMAITGGVYFTGAFALLWAGLYWKRASTKGAYVALATGLLMILGLAPVREGLDLEVSEPALGFLVVGLASGSMVLGSLLFPDGGRPARGGVP